MIAYYLPITFAADVRPDLLCCFSGKTSDELLSCVCNHYGNVIRNAWRTASSYPVHDLKNTILSMLNSVADTSFEEILENNDGADVQKDDGITNNEDCPLRCEADITVSYNKRILSAMKKSSSFVLTGAALALPEEVTHESNISMRYLAICRFYDSEGENNVGKAGLETQEIVDELKKMFLHEHDLIYEVDSEMKDANIDSKISKWTNSSEVAHLARNKCQLKRKADAEQSADHTQSKCTCERFSRRYLRSDARIESAQRMPMELFDQSSVRIFKTRSTVVIICGFPKQEVLKLTGHRYGWLILINLDILAMVQYNMSDIRFLSSRYLKWEQKSVVNQEVCHKVFDKFRKFVKMETNFLLLI